MGGQDETRARAALIAMQERLAGGPHAALGIAPTATPAEIRTAFLALTKTYHPARFGYMSAELQKLANEVFLSLRAAHDSIARPTRGWANRSDRSGVFLAAHRGDRSGSYPAIGHTPGKPLPVQPAAPAAPARVAPSRPPPAPLAPAPDASRMTPSGGVRLGAMRSPAAPPAPAAPPPPPASSPSLRPATGRPASAPPGAPPRPDDRELAGVLQQLQRGQWAAARATLTALAERAPHVPRYRALICYARGREAQLAHRVDEARVELQDALQIDPDLQLAKTALAELFTRRK